MPGKQFPYIVRVSDAFLNFAARSAMVCLIILLAGFVQVNYPGNQNRRTASRKPIKAA